MTISDWTEVLTGNRSTTIAANESSIALIDALFNNQAQKDALAKDRLVVAHLAVYEDDNARYRLRLCGAVNASLELIMSDTVWITDHLTALTQRDKQALQHYSPDELRQMRVFTLTESGLVLVCDYWPDTTDHSEYCQSFSIHVNDQCLIFSAALLPLLTQPDPVSSNPDQLVVNLSIEQAELVVKALTLYSKLGLGRLDELVNLVKSGVIPNRSPYLDLGSEASLLAKAAIFSPITLFESHLKGAKAALGLQGASPAINDPALHKDSRNALALALQLNVELSAQMSRQELDQ